MVNADRMIIVFNKRLDKAERRERFTGTVIDGASLYESRNAPDKDNYSIEEGIYRIRIPIDADTGSAEFMPESRYDELSGDSIEAYWTIHIGDRVIVCDDGITRVVLAGKNLSSIDELSLKVLANEIGYQKRVIRIVSYADNTLRGTDPVRHWRIGGA